MCFLSGFHDLERLAEEHSSKSSTLTTFFIKPGILVWHGLDASAGFQNTDRSFRRRFKVLHGQVDAVFVEECNEPIERLTVDSLEVQLLC